MPTSGSFIERFWSIAAAIVIFGLLALSDDLLRSANAISFSEAVRAIGSVCCIFLLVHSWLKQRTSTTTWHGLVYCTLVLLLPTLGAIWLGLNVVRFYSYAPDSVPNMYSIVMMVQDVIVWCSAFVGIIAVGWSVFGFACWLGKRLSLPRIRS